MELQEAADALGVHYQTAYRWVRSGRLPAQLVDNRYVVARQDLDAVEASRRTPAAPTTPSRRRVERQAELMHDALLDGDEATVHKLARRLVDDGTSICDFDEEEKNHQYSIETTMVHFDHGGMHFHVADTPGYPDFVADAVTSMGAAGCAVLVVGVAFALTNLVVDVLYMVIDPRIRI